MKRVVIFRGGQLLLVLLLILALEGITRILHLAPGLSNQWKDFVHNEVLPFKPRPYSRLVGRAITGEFDFDYKHNSLGLRDEEHPVAKIPGTFRVLGIGDSFTYGAGVAYEDGYLFKLEKMLNERPGSHPHIEIIKAGIPRYWAEPERLFLQYYGKPFLPDLILVQFHPNDLIDTYFGMEAMTVSPFEGYLVTSQAAQLGTLGTALFLHSHLARLFLARYTSYKIQRDFPVHWSELFQANGFHEKEWLKLESEYARMVEIARELKALIVFIQIPFQPPWNPGSAYPATRLTDWCKAHQAYFIDSLPALAERSKSVNLYWKRDGHCNGAGYEVIAENAFESLTAEKLVP